MKKIDLCGTWKLYDQEGKSYHGTVPGCVHTDLFSLSDMFWEKNSEKCQFIEKQDWTYTSLSELAKIAEDMGAPALPLSGRQEYLQSVINEIMFK